MRNATTKIRHSSELGTLYPEKGSAKRYFHVVMDEVRIKDLASASGQLAEFDAFEFIVDVPTAAASMKVSGKEIKGVMAPKMHTHVVSDITGLSGELDKKLDKKGGTISGDLSVMGDTYLRRLHLEEFLEVPEYRYNRIETVVGDKWSAPGGGIVELVSPENRTLVVKLEEGETSTLRENDLCMGIFLNSAMDASSSNTVDSDDSFGNRTYAGFTTCYFRLTECLDRDTYAEWRYELREGYPYHPQAAMQFVAFGNTTDKECRTSRYETRTYLRFLTGMDDWTIRTENIAAQFGDLSNLKAHGLDMSGYSAYLKNIYLTGFLSDKSGDSWFDPAKPDAGTDFDELMQTISSTLETLGRINSDEYVSPVEKSFLKERLQDIRTEYEQLRANALRLLSVFRYRSTNGKFLMVHGKRRAVRLLADEWTPYEDAYQRAVAAIGKYTQPEPEFIPIGDDFADIEAYYTARRTIGALLDEAAKSDNSDLEYLRENFQDISTEIEAGSGVVLSGFVGVKDDTDKKVVAGMAGCALKGAPASKHGKLMFFAGADGIENAATAATRIYEDGHVEMASGIFSGYSKVQFKYFTDEGTDYNASTRKYTLNRNFNLIANGADFGSYIVWLNLPVSSEYIGSVVNLYDCPIRTRSSPSLVLAADDTQSGIVTTLKKDAYGMGYLPVPRIETYGGLLQLLAVPSPYSSAKCMWHVTYQMMSEFRIYEE